ncbi:glycosyltransferase family 4 protein [Zhihengliuella flava]|uniref:Glycosyltransferase involved in cell wall biosynthesis n=1 Tax=Zhihengliuella flava TaxID=1285193 RepID=A0A931DAX9_9MICC|nr:glycosyltransferase family 4 protein [Zhihengliuella flava]MBG6083543.1 glycosyltransferase involved in cell wall biosynthesis [Zhihengliuella flava]
MSKPKLAIVNVFFPPQSIGGATRVVADNVRVLEDRYGHEFDLVFYTSDEGDTPAHELEIYTYNGRRVYRAGIVRRINMDWHPFDPESGRLFEKFLEHEQPDLIHFHCIQRLTSSIVEVTAAYGIPYFITVHDAWWISDHQFLVDQYGTVHPYGHADPYSPLPLPNGVTAEESETRRQALAELMLGADELLTVSESFAELYRINGFPDIKVAMNGIQTEGWRERTESFDGRVRLGHIGGMAPHKGFTLLKAILQQERFDNLSLTVTDLSKPHGYEQHTTWGNTPVTVVGKYPQQFVPDLYARLDVLLAPSTWPESFGLVTREAAAAGCWVVASDIGGIGEQVVEDRTGYLVHPNDRTSLVSALRKIDADPERFCSRPEPTLIRSVEEQVDELVLLYRNSLSKARIDADVRGMNAEVPQQLRGESDETSKPASVKRKFSVVNKKRVKETNA